MAELVPVDHDPFADTKGPQLVPVEHDPFAPAAETSVPLDAAKSFYTGLAKGGIGLAGAPGDIATAAKAGADWVGSKLPELPTPAPGSFIGRLGQLMRDETAKSANLPAAQVGSGDLPGSYVPPTSAQLQRSVEGVTGEFYKPKTVAGEYAQTAGEFAPAMIGGPESFFAKIAPRVAIPAAVSETAGQLTKGTAAEPYARVAGALASPLATMGIERAIAPAAASVAPTVAELKTAARAGYNSPEVAAVEIHPQSVADLSAKIEDDLINRGFRPRNTPGTFDEVRNLTTPTPGATSFKVADIDSSRKALGVMAKEVDAVGKPTAEAAAASTAMGHINDYLPNIAPSDVIAGDAPAAAAILKSAGENWGAAKRAESVDVRLTRADRQAAKSGSGSNIENAMRQKIAGMLDVPSRSVGYSAPEIDKMEEIVRGTPARNVLRKVGKFGVDGGLSLLLHAGSAISTGGWTLPVAAAGTAARKVGEALTSKAGRDLSEMVRSRSQLGQANAATAAVPPVAVGQNHGVNAVTSALLANQGNRDLTPPPISPAVAKILKGLQP